MQRRVIPVILLIGGVLGIISLSAWYYYQVRVSVSRGGAHWVGRMADLLQRDREDFAHSLDTVPADGDTRELLQMYSRGERGVVATFITDLKTHRTEQWLHPSIQKFFRNIDPRLGVLQARVQATHNPESGPVLRFGNALYNAAARPLLGERILIVVARAPRPWAILEEESQVWGMRCSVYDMDEHLVFASRDTTFAADRAHEIVLAVRDKYFQGSVPLDPKNGWQWLANYYYDASSRWVFVVGQPVRWLYLPVIFFVMAFVGSLWLMRLPLKGTQELRRQHQAAELHQWAKKVDSYVHGREPALKDPPYPFQELSPIVTTLRWLMPQWQKAEAYPRELALERKLLAILVESLPEAILFFNRQGSLQLSNELGRVFFGMQQEAGREYKMQNGMQVPRGFLEAYVEPVFTGVQLNSASEVEVPWADGKYLYRIWVERVEEPDTEVGIASGYIVVIRDITFRRNWEYVQEQVLSGITHDLRGPLSAVMGYLDLMKRQVTETSNTKLAEYLKLARDAGVRLTQMVSDILDVVRFEQGKIELNIEPVKIVDIFNNLRTTFGVSADQKKINLQFLMNGDADSVTFGDHKMLERIFDNLVGNAIKFTPTHGKIEVIAQQEKGRVTFSVTDTGRGIPREAQSRIFDKFQQVRPGDRSAGYGLGLAVVKFIVQAHRGEIRVESEVGAGSRFTFWIPNQTPSVTITASAKA